MRWTKIDETTRSDHFYLDEADECFHMREYFARSVTLRDKVLRTHGRERT